MSVSIGPEYGDCKEKGKKKGLSATPSGTLPWPAIRLQEPTLREVLYRLQVCKFPVVITNLFPALPPADVQHRGYLSTMFV